MGFSKNIYFCLGMTLGLTGCFNVMTDASTTTVNKKTETTVVQQSQTTGTVSTVNNVSGQNNGEVEFSPDAVLEKVAASKRPFATGWTPSTGIWMISRQKVRLKDNLSNQDALNIAEIKAKKKIAEFMGSNLSAKDQAYMSVDNSNGQRQFKQSFSSMSTTTVNQFLRGVTLLKAEKKGDSIIASFYVTSKMIDATREMEEQLRKAPPGTVRTSGYAIIVNNRISPAKQAALQLALRNAVEQIMGTTVVGQSSLMNNAKVKSKIISQAVGNIKRYRIIKEGVLGINYQVITVSEIDKSSLLENYTSMVRSMGDPAFFINTEDPDLRIALSGFMKDLGFKVSASSAAADFIVDAGCNYLDINDEHYGKGIQIDVQIRLLNKKSGELYFAIQNKPRLTSTFSGTFHQIRQEAARKAFKFIRKPYHEKINKVIFDWVTNGREISVVYDQCPGDARYVSSLENALNNIPGAKVLGKELKDQKLTFKCICIGSTADFEEFLQEAMATSFGDGAVLPKTRKIELNEIQFVCPR